MLMSGGLHLDFTRGTSRGLSKLSVHRITCVPVHMSLFFVVVFFCLSSNGMITETRVSQTKDLYLIACSVISFCICSSSLCCLSLVSNDLMARSSHFSTAQQTYRIRTRDKMKPIMQARRTRPSILCFMSYSLQCLQVVMAPISFPSPWSVVTFSSLFVACTFAIVVTSNVAFTVTFLISLSAAF